MHNAFNLSRAPIVSDIKERVDSLLLHGDKLHVGCANGSLRIYGLSNDGADVQTSATLEKTIKQLSSKKPVEQLGIIKETNSLVSLSDGVICLHDLHTHAQQTVLGSTSQTKGQANLFALDTSIQTGASSDTAKGKERATPRKQPLPQSQRGSKGKEAAKEEQQSGAAQESIPVVVTTLAVACRRRLVLFSWRDGQWQEPHEIALPHQIRSLAFPLPHSLFLGFSTGEYGTATLPFVTNLSSMAQPALSELFTPTFPQPSHDASSAATAGTSSASSHTLGAIPGMGTLGGLAAKTGGIMGLGSKVERNVVVKVKAGEVLAMKENIGVLLDARGKPSRASASGSTSGSGNSIEYALQPEETITSWPYILSILPAPAAVGNLTKAQAQDPLTALPTIHVHSIPNLTPTQAIRVPPLDVPASGRPVSIIDVPPPPVPQAARLLTTASSGKGPLALVTHAYSEVAASSSSSTSSAGTKIHLLSMSPWSAQLDDLVSRGAYEEALSLLTALDNPSHALPDWASRKQNLVILSGLSMFLNRRKYEAAIDTFIEENVNPAKVVALFPRAISGKLYLEREDVEAVWGGRTREQYLEQQVPASAGARAGGRAGAARPEQQRRRQETAESVLSAVTEKGGRVPDSQLSSTPPPSATQPSWRFSSASAPGAGGGGAKQQQPKKDDDAVSIRSMMNKTSFGLLGGSRERDASQGGVTINRESEDDLSFKMSVDVLMRYLPDRRQQFLRALAALPPHVRPTPTSGLPSSPSNSPSDLFSLPDASLSTYTPAQLQRTAQVVETALFKCYLHAKPGLLGPLCRIENWCEVEEVEELLLDAKKYKELLDLYNGKGRHEKAINLLQRMADEPAEKPIADKVAPTVAYLQKLGSPHLDLIFRASEWVFSLSPSLGLEIFTADIEEVETLPRHAVAMHLQAHAPTDAYRGYLEHVVFALGEAGPEFHERLAELYLDEVEALDAAEKEDAEVEASRQKAYDRLLGFLETSSQYRADRLLGRIRDDGKDEMRAILLGRLGQHDGALQIYVYKLKDHARAEEYCKRVYNAKDPSKSGIFLTLLKVYLRPKQQDGTSQQHVSAAETPSAPLFAPALALLSTQGARMDTGAALDLLPPLVTVRDVRVFLGKSIRRSVSSGRARRVEKRVWTARMDEVERTLVDLEGRRVKITDGRLCPLCRKRLGNSVIAVHSPGGEVTHYQCRDRWIEAKMQSGY